MNTSHNDRHRSNRISFFSHIMTEMEKMQDCQPSDKLIMSSIAKNIVVAHIMMIRWLNENSDPAVDVYRSLENKQDYFVRNEILTYKDLLDLKVSKFDESPESLRIIIREITAPELGESQSSKLELKQAAISGGLENEEALIYENVTTLNNAKRLYSHLNEPIPPLKNR
jgi:hypothetical protein